MTLVPMRFKGVQWHHNPKEICFECTKNIKELNAPYSNSYIQNLGRKAMTISGTGELYGGDCMEQFGRLYYLFKLGGVGVLAIQNTEPMYAVFESIKIIGEPKPDVLTYSFAFKEVMEYKSEVTSEAYTAKQDETLWDVSYVCGVKIDTLVQLNKWVKRPDISLEGRVIKLC